MPDAKLTELEEQIEAIASDMIYIVTDMESEPISKKITVQSMVTSMFGLMTGDIQEMIDNSVDDAMETVSTPMVAGSLTRSADDASGNQTITLAAEPKMIMFSAVDDADANTSSDGWDDSLIRACSLNQSLSLLSTLISRCTKSHSLAVSVITLAGNGHTAYVSSKSSTGFTLTWVRNGSGRDITVRYLAIF